jgi:hypothetical protein
LVLDPNMHEHGHRDVVSGDAQGLEVGQGLVEGAGREPADAGQLVGADALVDRRVHQVPDDIPKLPAPLLGDAGSAGNDLFGFLHCAHQQR